MADMAILNGEPHVHPVERNGAWARVAISLPLMNGDVEEQSVFKWWANIAHADIAADGNGVGYLLEDLHKRMFDVLAPISYQRVVDLIETTFATFDFRKFLPPHPWPQLVTERMQ